MLWLDAADLDGAAPYPTTEEGVSAVGDVTLFVSERDRYIDGPIIYEDALAEVKRRQVGSDCTRPHGPDVI